MPRLRRPKEITYPENPWQGIARVTVRRKDYRFDGKYGSPESVEQHAEWVRIYDVTGRPPEIEAVRASLLVQRESIPLPVEYEEPSMKAAEKMDYRFPLAMVTAIGCTLLLSYSLLNSRLAEPSPSPSPNGSAYVITSQSTEKADSTVPKFTQPPVAPPGPPAMPEALEGSKLDKLTREQHVQFGEIMKNEGHLAAMEWLRGL